MVNRGMRRVVTERRGGPRIFHTSGVRPDPVPRVPIIDNSCGYLTASIMPVPTGDIPEIPPHSGSSVEAARNSTLVNIPGIIGSVGHSTATTNS